jgi:hypothetical protein
MQPNFYFRQKKGTERLTAQHPYMPTWGAECAPDERL